MGRTNSRATAEAGKLGTGLGDNRRPVEPPAPAPAPATWPDDVFQAPREKTGQEQMRDYCRIPQWSPYYRFEGQSVQVGRAMSTDIGNFPKTQASRRRCRCSRPGTTSPR